MRRVVADSNIYISALTRGGKPLQLLDLARAGQIELAVSEPILSEITRVLRDKFHWTAEDLADAREQMAGYTRCVTPAETLNIVNADPDDDRILECAVAAGSEVVVTGDAHLLQLGTYQGIKIMKPADFLGQPRWTPKSGN